MCGGTSTTGISEKPVRGLSPRVRGNRAARPALLHIRGSIPACAGEPLHQKRRLLSYGVYPRVCGGTIPAMRATLKI